MLFGNGKSAGEPASGGRSGETPRGNLPYIEAGIFSRAPLGKINYCTFQASGKDEEGKARRLRIDTVSEQAAYEQAIQSGITDPVLTLRPPRKPTGEQLDYAGDLGITVPADACEEDVSCMLARVAEGDESIPTHDAAVYADHKGMHFSAWIGERAFYNQLWNRLGARDKLTFFCYAVKCHLTARRPGNPESDPDIGCFEAFADRYIHDRSVTDSLAGYDGEDLIEFGTYGGRTNTAAYAAAAREFVGI
ncbi:MAG: hypothetical protein GX628_00375 [Clostridiales bacterium]|mgnify:FL=1|nr:hypothetical protein [Clostridiales bacterium]